MLGRSPPQVTETVFNEGAQAIWNGKSVRKRGLADSLGQPSEAALTTLNYITRICLPCPDGGGVSAKGLVGNEQRLIGKGKTAGPLGREGTELLLRPERATL